MLTGQGWGTLSYLVSRYELVRVLNSRYDFCAKYLRDLRSSTNLVITNRGTNNGTCNEMHSCYDLQLLLRKRSIRVKEKERK